MAGLTRRTVLLGATLAPVAAHAQKWPPAVVRLIVPFPPGGSVDAIARLIHQGLQDGIGATLVIENKGGASGSVGAAQVAKSPPDGSTWLLVFDTHGVNPFLLAQLPYDTEKDFEPVTLIGTAPHVIATHPSRPYKSLADVITAAKAKPDTISYGTIGTGSLGHLTMTLLSRQAGVKLVHVPYRGGGPLLNDALAGHVDLMIASTGAVAAHLTSGSFRHLGQTGRTRIPVLPDVPTVIEAGYDRVESYAWWGMFAPAKTPPEIVGQFRTALVEAIREERVQKQLTETLVLSLALGPPEELRQFLSEQMQKWSAVIRENNIKADG